jgi:phosphomannomutase/phosphoglucomutase
MINPFVFREYDIRGVAESDFSDEMVYALGRTLGTYFLRREVERLSIGRDCRLSSPRLHQLLTAGLMDTGCRLIDCGVIPTPLLYFSLFHFDTNGGVMVTGSHNPPDNNGFKICMGKTTIYGEEIQMLRGLLEVGEFIHGKGETETRDIVGPYLKTVHGLLRIGPGRRKVIIDSGNGTAGTIAAPLYRGLGFDVVELYSEMDGTFPHHHPDPLVPENLETLVAEVKRQGADLGIAFDGDADRIGVVDERGAILWGDQLMILFARAILQEVPGATFVAEVKCSQALFDDIEARGGKAIMARVGHSLMKAKIKETKAELAGEMSGHIFFANRYYGYDDAIYAGARLLELLSHTDRTVSSLLADVPPAVATPEIRMECSDRIKFEVVARVVNRYRASHQVIEVDGARILFEGGWGLVRASNTQPVLVLRFEARDEQTLQKIRAEVEAAVAVIIHEVAQG